VHLAHHGRPNAFNRGGPRMAVTGVKVFVATRNLATPETETHAIMRGPAKRGAKPADDS